MGDDRRGRTPRSGGRAPWERYPTAEPTETENTGRRSRHADAAPESGSAPLTVQDLVDRVDSERIKRRRPAPAPEAPPSRAGRRAREQAPRPTPRADIAPRTDSSPVASDIAGTAPSPADRTATTALPVGMVNDPGDPVTDILPAITDTTAPPKRATPVKTAPPAPPKRPDGDKRSGADGHRRRQLRMAGRVSLTFMAVLALVITGGGWSYLQATNSGFTQVSALDGSTDDVLDGDMQLGDENYLIVGTDTRAGLNAGVGAGTVEDAEGARADTVMLVHIPENRSRVVVVSFPRDLDVSRPQCTAWDNDKGDYTNEKVAPFIGDKLNAVYAAGGPRCLVDVVRKMSGLNIGHFIGIDFAGFEAMVDKIGGVEVCSTKPIIDGVLGTVLETSGRQVITGQSALNYVRARHVIGEERSDYDRIHRQQQFLSALLRGALSSKVLLDPGKLQGFVDAFREHTFVDGVATQDLILLGRSLQKVSAGAVTFITAPTAGTTNYGNEIPRESDIKAIFRAIIDDQPLPGEETAPPITSSTTPAPATEAPKIYAVNPSSVSVRVSNGSGLGGLAQQTANRLGAQGFGIYHVGNYAMGTSETTKVRYAEGNEAEAATVASAIPGASIERSDDLAGGIVDLILGADFSGTVRTPTPVSTEITGAASGEPITAAPVALPSDLEHMNAADTSCD
ncbi:LCP family protein [Nocardia sp. AG03]|uniref:LCP family glycopolymer transferase n=1 Tax=Nocardia sp. AG03 TaxID=3025312 RepID=UPI0024187396|nr:LCP family protein [Nocardia sp. AG03]